MMRSLGSSCFKLLTPDLFCHKSYHLSNCYERLSWHRILKNQVIASKDAKENHVSQVLSGLDTNCRIDTRVQWERQNHSVLFGFFSSNWTLSTVFCITFLNFNRVFLKCQLGASNWWHQLLTQWLPYFSPVCSAPLMLSELLQGKRLPRNRRF